MLSGPRQLDRFDRFDTPRRHATAASATLHRPATAPRPRLPAYPINPAWPRLPAQANIRYQPRFDFRANSSYPSETIDQYATVAHSKALVDGFVVHGKRPHAAYDLSLSRARRVGGAWLYCDGSFPDEPSRTAGMAVCDSARFPGGKARLPAEDRQLYVPKAGTPGVRVRWLWSETEPMIF